VTRFCGTTWTPRPGTRCWHLLDRIASRPATRPELEREMGVGLSWALRELARAGLIEARGVGAGSCGWVVTSAGRAVLGDTVSPPAVEPAALPQREPVRAGRRWLLGCGIHTSARARTRCSVCDAAHAATLAALDDGAVKRHLQMTSRTTLAMSRRMEAHGTTAGPRPKFNAVTVAAGRRR
jgi:hypothetical protein